MPCGYNVKAMPRKNSLQPFMIGPTIPSMGRKKHEADRHVTPRKPIRMPLRWHLLAAEMASEDEKPLLHYIMKLLAKEAEAQGRPRPPFPWEPQEPPE